MKLSLRDRLRLAWKLRALPFVQVAAVGGAVLALLPLVPRRRPAHARSAPQPVRTGSVPEPAPGTGAEEAAAATGSDGPVAVGGGGA